ncbi:hypothetical protein M8J76_010574 [Diaphorina citri]|nr:hypothetical protein M8J75_015096 [Diaphorina citri]KAI5722583.1 hypothetical protein M8J76_010574 [Diaphorina citri]KAI5726072.1 hypothetical protein M8J77_023421 [Diaphorina citri]
MEGREEGEVSGDEYEGAEIRSGIYQHCPQPESHGTPSTSEVLKVMESIMTAQNQSFQLILNQFTKRTSEQKSTFLLEFNPDQRVDARAWLSTADVCLQDGAKEGGAEMILAISRAMKGKSAQWFAQTPQ